MEKNETETVSQSAETSILIEIFMPKNWERRTGSFGLRIEITKSGLGDLLCKLLRDFSEDADQLDGAAEWGCVIVHLDDDHPLFHAKLGEDRDDRQHDQMRAQFPVSQIGMHSMLRTLLEVSSHDLHSRLCGFDPRGRAAFFVSSDALSRE